MEITAIVLASLSIIVTALVGWLVYKRTAKILNRMKAILIARVTPAEYKEMLRLIEDIERTGEKRGTIVHRSDDTWGINWAQGAFFMVGGYFQYYIIIFLVGDSKYAFRVSFLYQFFCS